MHVPRLRRARHLATATTLVLVAVVTPGPPAAAQSLSCSIAAPAPGAVVSGSAVALSAAAGGSPTSVKYYLDGVYLGPAAATGFGWLFTPTGTAPYGWNSRTKPNGPHTLTCRATKGSTTVTSAPLQLTVSNPVPNVALSATGPGVTIASPGPGVIMTGQAQLTMNVTIPGGGSPTSGKFVLLGATDTEIPATCGPSSCTASWASSSIMDGGYSMTASATDIGGNVGSSDPLIVTIVNSPHVWMTAPSAMTPVAGTGVTLSAKMLLPNGVTGTVSFALDGTTLTRPVTCSGTTCSTTWDTPTTNLKYDGIHRVVPTVTVTPGGGTASGDSHPIVVSNEHPGNPILTSEYEFADLGAVRRDGGYSEALPGTTNRSIWVFGDSGFQPKGGSFQFVAGNSVAISDNYTSGPSPLREGTGVNPAPPLSSPPQTMIQPLPGLTKLDGTPCSNARSWATGVTKRPDADTVLITTVTMCHQPKPGVPGTDIDVVQRFGITEYQASTNSIFSQQDLFIAPVGGELDTYHQMGSPTTDGTYVYVYRAENGAQGGAFGTYVARAKLASGEWMIGDKYEFWTTTGWSRTGTPASILPAGKGSYNTNLSVDRYPSFGGLYVMIFQDWDNLEIWTSSTPAGPWTHKTTMTGVCAKCYSVYGHDEFSTPTSLAITYYSRTDAADRVYRASIPWT